MRTTLLLQLLVRLVLALSIESQDETASETTTTDDGVYLPQYQSEMRMNTTERNPLSKQEYSSANHKPVITAGNSLCRSDTYCDFHQNADYNYCYIDYSNNWDYCCVGRCDYHGYSYQWCQSGIEWQYCGNAGNINIDGIQCHYASGCGMHQEKSRGATYWCYVDHKLNWNRCCAPHSKCGHYGYKYTWCYTGYKRNTHWSYCK